MNDWGLIRMGIPRPKTAEEINAQATIDGMRKAIWESQRDSVLIKNALITADYAGMSGEDRYVFLAYHALVALEEVHGEFTKWVAKSPRPPWIIERTAVPTPAAQSEGGK